VKRVEHRVPKKARQAERVDRVLAVQVSRNLQVFAQHETPFTELVGDLRRTQSHAASDRNRQSKLRKGRDEKQDHRQTGAASLERLQRDGRHAAAHNRLRRVLDRVSHVFSKQEEQGCTDPHFFCFCFFSKEKIGK